MEHNVDCQSSSTSAACFGGGDPARAASLVPGEHEPASIERLQLVVEQLFQAIHGVVSEDPESVHACLSRAGVVLRKQSGEGCPTRAGMVLRKPLDGCGPTGREIDPNPIPQIRGGLAPWQIRRVTTYIEAQIDSPISTKELAALVRLSTFHFCRSFKSSFAESPHAYVMRRRVERAQGLMLTTELSLGQIAADCGLADQAHFNKLFRRFVGDSPGAWRRARAI